MPTKTELALKTKEELIEDLLGLTDEKEKLKKKLASAGGNVTEDLVKALQIIANKGNGTPDQPMDMTTQGYAVLPPIPINAMLPIQKVKWRLDNITAIMERGDARPGIMTEYRRKIFVWQKKFTELYETMVKESPDLLKEDTKLTKTPDQTGKMVGFHLKEYYDTNVEEIHKRIAARAKENAKYGMPLRHHEYK